MNNTYWIPLIENGKFKGKAIPLPLNKEIIPALKKRIIKGRESIIWNLKGKIYVLGLNKIFSTPGSANIELNTINEIDKKFLTYYTPRKSIAIKLSGRLKGISKAKKVIFSSGSTSPQNLDRPLDYYSRPIYTKWGTIGLKVTLG